MRNTAPPRTASTATQLHALREQLEARAETLRAELRAVDEDREGGPRLTPHDTVEDAGEQGEQRSRDAVRSAEQERDFGELREIAAALARMQPDREGHVRYGECTDCGAAIPLARLRAQPAAARCITCQELHERAHPPVVRALPSP